MADVIFDRAIADIMDAIGIDAEYKGRTIKVDLTNGIIVASEVETRAPMAECLDRDIEGAAHGDAITIKSVTYTVIGIEPSGDGTTMLVLSGDLHG